MNRTRRTDVLALHTATRQIFLAEGQTIYETNRAWEIWEDGKMLRRIVRYSKQRVLFVLIGEAWHSV